MCNDAADTSNAHSPVIATFNSLADLVMRVSTLIFEGLPCFDSGSLSSIPAGSLKVLFGAALICVCPSDYSDISPS